MKKTFIKMQSLSRKAWLCGGLIAMAAALAGCSSDAPDPGADPNPGVAQTDGDPLTIISDQATLSGLVLNYDEYYEELEDDDLNTLKPAPDYSNAVSVFSDGFDPNDLSEYKNGIIIPDGTTYEKTLNLGEKGNVAIFIAGVLKGNISISSKGNGNGNDNGNGKGGSANVYILEKGGWIADANSLRNSNLNIYDYDNGLTFNDNVTDVTMLCSYYGKEFDQSSKRITLGGEKNNEGGIFVKGAIKAETLTMLGDKMQIKAKCLRVKDAYITSHNNAKHYVSSYISAENITMGEKAQFLLGNNAYVSVTGNLVMVKNSLFKAKGQANIKVANLYTSDRSKGNDKLKKANNGKFNMGGKFKGTIHVYVGALFEGELNGAVQKDINDIHGTNDNVTFHSGDEYNNFTEPMTECPVEGGGNGGNGGGEKPDPVNPNPNPNPNPFTNMPEVIIEITGKEDDEDHTHPISATGIDVWGNKVYVSWHERGGGIHGCIETVLIEGSKATITSWMETDEWKYPGDLSGATASTAYDFNHIIYDPDTKALLTVGEHAKKGGFIGRIKLGKTFYYGAELNILENRQLGVEEWDGNKYEFVAGRSGNCVVISPTSSDGKKYLLVASRGGYQVIPYGVDDPFAKGENGKHIVTSEKMKAVKTDGSAKHLALYGNQLVSIEYTASYAGEDWWEDNTTTLDAKISFWDNWENFPGKPMSTKDVPAFSPVFGKDVIAMDDEYIYSCQGHNGVVIYDKSLNVKARFNVDQYIREHRDYFTRNHIFRMTGAAANGLAVDDQYLYIAYGGAGLWVLNKVTFEPVGFYVTAGTYPDNESKKASANYVKVMEDGKIVVAYGRDGVKVLEMKSTPKDSKV